MKPIRAILTTILIVSGLLPVPVIISSLFNQSSASLMLELGQLTTPLQSLLLINGAYMLSFIIMFWIAAYWVVKNNAAGITLSIGLGLITLFRGALLIGLFSSHQTPPPFLAIVATIDGVIIIAVSFIARKNG